MPELFAEIGLFIFEALTTLGVPIEVAATIANVAAFAAVAALAVGSVAELVQLLESPTPDGIRQTFRQPSPARRRGGGTARLGGPYLVDYANTINDLFRVVASVDGPVTDITRYYLSQDQVQVNPSTGVVAKMLNGAYPNSCANFTTSFGVTGVQALPGIASAAPEVWGPNAFATGIFVLGCKFYGGSQQSFSTAYPRDKPSPNVVGKVGVAYDWRDPDQHQADPTTWKNSANPIVGLITELWRFRGYDWTADFLPTLASHTAEADACDAAIAKLNVFGRIIDYSGPGATHLNLDPAGDAPWVGATIFYGGQSFVVTGVSSVTVDGVPVKQVTWSGGGLLSGAAIQTVARWQATPSHPYTEPTYAYGGVWNADEDEATTAKKFIDAMDGWYMRRGLDGAVVVRCGRYYAPTVTIGADEIISFTWEPFNQLGRTKNQVVPFFVSPAHDYTQIDTDPWDDADDQAVNGISSEEFKPDFVQANGQARRLAKRRTHKLVTPINSLTLKMSGFRILGERFIAIEAGGYELVDFESCVVEIVGEVEILDNGLAIRVPVQLAAPTIDAWDAYADEGDGPSDTAGPGGSALGTASAAPTISAVTSSTQGPGSGVGSGIILEVVAVPPAAVAARADLTWWVQWMVAGANSWQPPQRAPDLGAGTVTVDTGFVPADEPLLVQVAYQTGGGQLSPWSASSTVTVSATGELDFSLAGNPLIGAL